MLGRVIGLDLGSHSIKLVALRQGARRLEIAALRTLPAQPDWPTALAELGAPLLAGARVVCALPSDRITHRTLHFPFRDRRRLERALPFEIESATPFSLEDIALDYELWPNPDGGGSVLASVVRREGLVDRVSALHAAGVRPRVLEAEGSALANLETTPSPDAPRVLVDLGHRKTTLVLLVDGSPRAIRTLPFGGAQLNRALAEKWSCSEAEAEHSKCEGSDGDLLDLPGVAPLLDGLARRLVRALAGFPALLAGAPIGELTLLGGSSLLSGLETYLSERTGIAARRLADAPLALGREETDDTPIDFGPEDLARFAPALALALRGTGRARTRTNFLQGELAPRFEGGPVFALFRPSAWLAATAAALAIAATVTQSNVADRRADATEARLATLWSRALPDRALPADVPSALNDALRDARARAAQLGLYGGELSALELLTQLAAAVPDGLSLLFDELAIDGRVVRVRGHTPSFAAVDQLQAALAQRPHFRSIRVGEIQADPVRGGNTFRLSIGLRELGEEP